MYSISFIHAYKRGSANRDTYLCGFVDLHGLPVQYREVQGYESQRFLSYFPRLISLHGGVSTGFHHVSEPPPLEINRLYQISASTHHGVGASTRTHIAIRQVAAEAESLHKGDVFVLDLGTKVLQFNTRDSSGKERFLAADFVRGLVDSRSGQCGLTVYGTYRMDQFIE